MSKIHVLETDQFGSHLVIHAPVPVGNNSVGISWQAAGLASGRLGYSSLSVGPGLGQITEAERSTIANGSVVELAAICQSDSGGTSTAQRLATLNAVAVQAVSDWTAEFKAALKFYGYTVA